MTISGGYFVALLLAMTVWLCSLLVDCVKLLGNYCLSEEKFQIPLSPPFSKGEAGVHPLRKRGEGGI